MDDSKVEVVDRINEYLQLGGLFNPELANHQAVRDLLIDCRNHIRELRRELEMKVDPDPKLKRTTDLLDSLMITIMASVFLFFVVAVFAVLVHFGFFAILFSLTFFVAWGMIYLFISKEDP